MIRFLLLCLLLFVPFGYGARAAEPVRVAVAANFSPVAEELGQRFGLLTGEEITITSGASGTLVRQIQRGAPFDLFLSADENYIHILHREGLTQDTGQVYAQGVLVLHVPYSSGLNRMQGVEDMLQQLAEDVSLKLALANPETAPYGRAARQVLSRFAAPGQFAGREILGENVGQAAQFARTGNVDAAFIPYSLALGKSMQAAGHFELIPEDWYSPIRQRMALLHDAGNTAREFRDYLLGETAQQVIRRYGYTLPGKH